MSIFFWKKNKAIDKHAQSIADELYSQVQPEVAANYIKGVNALSKKELKQQKKAQTKVDIIINNAARQISQFKNTESLGVYGKARYHLTFMERLNDLGYPKETTKQLNEIILIMSS